jgi:NAD(P)-dependent dehydrogenase (short-subunit alcohol dehydrogenase family)
MDAEGAILIIIDINEDEIIKTKSMLKNKKSTAKVLDISNLADVKKFFKGLNKLDALINVAGILRFDNSHEVQIDDWEKILNVNLTGTFFMCSYALPLLLKSKGAIVNVSSSAAFLKLLRLNMEWKV